MGTADGAVVGLTTLLNNGANNARLNVVLVAEGFRAAELSDFDDACDDFVSTLQAEAWFPVLGGAVNIHRLDVSSTDSGADDPVNCGDMTTGSGATPATFFDAGFCNGGIRRCLSGDETIVRDTLNVELPEWHVAAVLVNTTQRGGCASGDVFWTALSSDWKKVVLHELGHAAFGLADEYHYWAGCDKDTDRDNAPAGEPAEPNVTTNTDAATLKWRNLLTPGVPVPTMLNPDCSKCDDRPNVLDDDHAIGLFEGAQYFHCGRFRPAYTCKMRDSDEEFCRVCLEAIAARLASFITPTPGMEVIPTFLDFGDVANGMTMYRALEVRNNRSGFPGILSVSLTALGSEFTFAPGEVLNFVLPAPILEAFTTRRVFVAFRAPTAGGPEFFDALDVSGAQDPGSSPTTVSLRGNAIPPAPVDSVLVIDRSGSMSGATGVPGQDKRSHAIFAAQLYISLLKPTDMIGLVRFNQVSNDPADILLNMRTAGALGTGVGRLAANAALTPAALNPSGTTSIGAGIIRGSAVLEAGTADARALVVLTDGIQNTNPDIPQARNVVTTKSPRQRVFAVGLGLNQLEDKLQQIASVTNGVAQITGELVDDKEFLLQKLYVQILSDVQDEAFVHDPRSVVLPGRKESTSIYIGDVDVSADFIIVFRKSAVFPKYMRAWLEAPDGTLIQPADAGTVNMDYIEELGHIFFRCAFPTVPGKPGTHAGRWKVWVENLTGRVGATTHVAAGSVGVPLFYSVMCKARSDFRLHGDVVQENYGPGSKMTVVLTPTLYGLPVEVDEPVRITVERPDGALRTVSLALNSEGEYVGTYVDTPLTGRYLFKADVSATSPGGYRVTRHRQMTGLIFRPGQGGHDGTGSNGEVLDVIKDLIEVLKKCCEEKHARENSSSAERLLEDLIRRLRP